MRWCAMHKYIAFYDGAQVEIEAESLYGAKLKAVAHFKPKKSKEHMVHVHLYQRDGEDTPITHIAVD